MIYRYLIALTVLFGCGPYPKDPNDTLQKVQNHVLRVGVADTKATDPQNTVLSGTEASIIQAFAKELNTKIAWTKGTQLKLIELLRKGELDVAVGGFTSASPLQNEAGFTRPYRTETYRVGMLPGRPVPAEIDGMQVVVMDPLVGAFVREKKGIPVRKDSFNTTDLLVAAPESELLQLNRKILPVELYKEEYVMAIPKGENAFLMKLEKLIERYAGTK